MKTLGSIFLTILALLRLQFALASTTGDNQNEISSSFEERQVCNGMYASPKKTSKIQLDLEDYSSVGEGRVSVLIFNWKEEEAIGISNGDVIYYMCDYEAVSAGLCGENEVGKYLVNTDYPHDSVLSQIIKLDEMTAPMVYEVDTTGLYCVFTYPLEGSSETYKLLATWHNYFGDLDASDYPRLYLYPVMLIVLAVVSSWWGYLIIKYRHDILPLQKYITIEILLFVLNAILSCVNYFYINSHGYSGYSHFTALVMAFSSAARDVYFNFLMLVVSLGYSIVVPSLGPVLRRCQLLAVFQFIFISIYLACISLMEDAEQSLFVALCALLYLITLFGSFIWTIVALLSMIRDLRNRKQTVKAMMFKRLWQLLVGFLLVYNVIIFTSIVLFIMYGQMEFYRKFWKATWFVNYGYVDIVALVFLCTILYLWRPTENNRRFAMSEQVAQDVDEFEMATSLSDTSFPRSARSSMQQAAGTNGASFQKLESNDDHHALFAVDDDSDEEERQALTTGANRN
ncbi:seven transmembrane receptor-like protein [Schizosaccharomyces japonicus yFS275]|uniref:Seven transmembrane receptor-like protein n=1 Tax=Schizosaccharomyces japonicus (strain yFS275 / FY16936) TaxID=402676 RepID=B6K1T1_SCHJY|nr:seven transmembrane receptor-like protein [Schizosaccharomyces japonicus yFS275]EEB07112.1 seven transmembrane receptor-like protein [Schizosaccharomyces japonicus yFS275]